MAMKMMKVFCVMVVCMVVSSSYAEALTCSDVSNKISPCLNYLKQGGEVPANCCAGVKGLNDAAKTTLDRQTACTCLKNSFKTNKDLKSDYAVPLPSKCGVTIPYKLSMETDCNKYVIIIPFFQYFHIVRLHFLMGKSIVILSSYSNRNNCIFFFLNCVYVCTIISNIRIYCHFVFAG